MRWFVPLLVALALAACTSDDGGDQTVVRPSTTSTSITAPAPSTTVAPSTTTTAVDATPADNPTDLAAQITGAEEAIRADGTPPDRVAAMARLQQAAYRQLAAHPEWEAAVLEGVPDHLDGAVRDNTGAARGLFDLVDPRPELPAWTIVDPAPAAELQRHYQDAGAEFGIPWEILAGIHLVETRMGRIRGTSTAGAQGPMQFLPGTWAGYGMGGDINDNRDAIRAAANLLRANGGQADMNMALQRYGGRPPHSAPYANAVQAYARQMQAEPRLFAAYHAWEVYYRTTRGDLHLSVGYASDRPIPVDEYLARG